jgi:hypothetical protein
LNNDTAVRGAFFHHDLKQLFKGVFKGDDFLNIGVGLCQCDEE